LLISECLYPPCDIQYGGAQSPLASLSIPMNFCHVKLLFICTKGIPLYGLSLLNKGANTIIFTQHVHMHTCTYTPSVGNIYQCKECSFICIIPISNNATFLGKKNIYLSLHSESYIISIKSKANEKKKELYIVILWNKKEKEVCNFRHTISSQAKRQ